MDKDRRSRLDALRGDDTGAVVNHNKHVQISFVLQPSKFCRTKTILGLLANIAWKLFWPNLIIPGEGGDEEI